MEIVSYPVGLLVGLLPVLVELGDGGAPARLVLDGRETCAITARAPACMVDLGPDPVVHLLEVVRTDGTGRVTERVERWVNRPGIEAELRVAGECDYKTKTCEFEMTWAHPSKLEPTEISVALDAVTISRGTSRKVRVGFPGTVGPRIITATANFPDGRRATFTRLIGDSYTEQADAFLEAVLINLEKADQDDNAVAARLLAAGWPLRTLERGSFDITFVVAPHALDGIPGLTAATGRHPELFASPLLGAEQVNLVVADERLASIDLWSPVFTRNLRRVEVGAGLNSLSAAAAEKESLWIKRLIRGTRGTDSVNRIRTADAVAAAGYDLGGSSRRRMLVLIVGADTEDESVFSAIQARTYLTEVAVPLVVWRIGGAAAPGWPAGPVLRGPADLVAQLAALRQVLERQRVAWVRRRPDSRQVPPAPPPGVALVGRETAEKQRARDGHHASEGKVVYAVAVEPTSPQTIYAGTRDGLEISQDGGDHWRPVSISDESPEIYAIGLDSRRGQVFAGSNGGISRQSAGDKTWQLTPGLPVFAVEVDPRVPDVALAATRGGLLRTTDGGLKWSSSSRGLEGTFPVAVAGDPRRRDVFYAATAGGGVFKSEDGGRSWRPAGLGRMVVRCLVAAGEYGKALYAGTDAGVFASHDAGRTWRWTSAGLPRAVVYALAADLADPLTLFAGCAAGLFESRDGGRSWRRMPGRDASFPISSIALDAKAGRLFAGSLGRGVLRFPLFPGAH